MTRAEFIQICGILGITGPLQGTMGSHMPYAGGQKRNPGKVLVIGAGAGGLSAGYLLNQQGINFEILEASGILGGRMKVNTEFADYPIPLGAEWLETSPRIFKEIVNDPSVEVKMDTVRDAPDRKFVNSSWLGFFQKYIVPSISDRISYHTIVKSIDYSGENIEVVTQNRTYLADRVVVSVPLKILQDRDISFVPSLPQHKLIVINQTRIWEGFKAFFEFSIKFYDEEYVFNVRPKDDGQKIYYNASFGQNTDRNILGLFVVGTPAREYVSRSGNALKAHILSELDAIYNHQATPNYIKHVVQNWNEEPFIKGGYMTDHANWKSVRILGEPVSNKLFFAGGAYTDGEDWVSVHAAAKSAKNAVAALIG